MISNSADSTPSTVNCLVPAALAGLVWSGSGLVWSGLVWSGLVWSGLVWSGLVCLVWSGLVWSGLVWSGLVWSGLVWSGLVWSGLVWSGLDWSGLVWSGLVWPGLAWPGLAWPGLAWVGLGWGWAESDRMIINVCICLLPRDKPWIRFVCLLRVLLSEVHDSPQWVNLLCHPGHPQACLSFLVQKVVTLEGTINSMLGGCVPCWATLLCYCCMHVAPGIRLHCWCKRSAVNKRGRRRACECTPTDTAAILLPIQPLVCQLAASARPQA